MKKMTSNEEVYTFDRDDEASNTIVSNEVRNSLEAPLLGTTTETSETTGVTQLPPRSFCGSFSPSGSRRRLWWVSFVFSIFLLIILPIIVNYEINAGVYEQIIMDSEKAMGYEQFRNRTSLGGTNMEYTFFNITNPFEVLMGAKPHLEEIGPFIYVQTQVRSDLEFDYEADTIAFRQQVYQTFLPHETYKRTNGRFDRDDIPITTINVLFFGMKAIVGREMWHLINEVTLWDTDFKRLFAIRTAHELIEGYDVPLKIGSLSIPISFPGFVPSHFDEKTDPAYINKNKIYIGKKDVKKVNTLIEWGPGKTHSEVVCPWGNNPLSSDCKYFKNNPCCGMNLKVKPWGEEIIEGLWNADANLVQGTLGDAFRPFLKRRDDEIVVVWSDQLYRPLQFHNRDALAVNLQGIELLRFTATSEFWSNATVHPPNARYHQFGPNGLLNASVLYSGAPIFVSLPHFLYADPILQDGVTGLNPDPEKHDMFIDIEPHTGMTFREHNRIQISAKVTGQERFGTRVWFPHVKDAYVPVGYFDSYSEINDVGVEQFLELYDGLSVFWGAMSLGIVLLSVTVLGSPIWTWFKLHHKKSRIKRRLLREQSLRSVIVIDDDNSDDDNMMDSA